MKKYWDDPYINAFEAKIVDILEKGDRFGVVLDGTYFFPEGGGQPSDRGYLASYPVLDVQEVDDVIVHFLERTGEASKQLSKGATVACKIDKEYRTNNMRLHSACHLLFGAARKMFSHVNYAGFNIGKLGNLYLETGQQITAEQLREMQLLANECVVDNRPISSYWVETQKAASLPGLAYNLELPDKQVRIIDIDGWDVAACSGTHLHNTIEIGPIKVVAREIHKKNVTRIDYAVGKSAVAAIAEDDKVVGETAVFLGTSKDQLTQIVRKLSSDLQGTQKSLRELRESVMEYKTRELLQGGETIEGTQLIVTAADYLDAKSLRVFASQLVAQRDSLVAAVIGGDDELTVVAACSQNVNINLVEPIVRVASKYGGGGGGRPNLVSAGGIKGTVQAVQNDVESELKRMLHNAPK